MEPASYLLGDVDVGETQLFGQAIEGAYRSVDEMLAEVLAAEPDPARIVVLSDHGFRENRDPKRATSSGWHRTEGLFAAAGPGIRENVILPAGSVVDVAPTVLYASGLPLAEDMDGRPALDLFAEGFREAHEPSWIGSYEPETATSRSEAPVTSPVDGQILERLRALGYIQ
jgi:predicted AlkP superfamily phosphohydrolase/phosphomutase